MKPYKLQQIDESLINQYKNLDQRDKCYFFGEYAIGKRAEYSELNQLIINFKKEMCHKGKSGWYYKSDSIKKVASLLTPLLKNETFINSTLVPIPSSKLKAHPHYDGRLLEVLQILQKRSSKLDVREMIVSVDNRESQHISGKRLSVEEHLNNIKLNENSLSPKPQSIILFDDILTTGASFKSAQILLEAQFPELPIIGLFIARAVIVSE